MSNNKEINQIIILVKECFKKNINNSSELSTLIDTYLIPQELEKKKNAEVSTPHKLRQDMLDKIPSDFWTTPKKVFEPCSGKGGFLIDILGRFMNGLKQSIQDETKRYKCIVEDCLYFSDINPTNIFICKLLLDPHNQYKLNFNEGNTLQLNVHEKWGINSFHAVIGNPPYNDASGNKGSNHTIWDKFIIQAFNKWLTENSYLVYVHPSSWRQKDNKLLPLFKQKQIHYLEIHNVDDGIKTFKCSTRYDWYVLQNITKYTTTIVKDEIGVTNTINMDEWDFIPNMMFNEIKQLITSTSTSTKLNVTRDRSVYPTENKDLVSKEKDNKYKYPLVYTINKNNELSLRYTNDKTKGHFGKSKFIFSNGAGFYCDKKGEYGLTEWAFCIYDEPNNLDNIEKAFRSEAFNKIKKAIHLDSQTYNIKVMKTFRNDFWRQFI